MNTERSQRSKEVKNNKKAAKTIVLSIVLLVLIVVAGVLMLKPLTKQQSDTMKLNKAYIKIDDTGAKIEVSSDDDWYELADSEGIYEKYNKESKYKIYASGDSDKDYSMVVVEYIPDSKIDMAKLMKKQALNIGVQLDDIDSNKEEINNGTDYFKNDSGGAVYIRVIQNDTYTVYAMSLSNVLNTQLNSVIESLSFNSTVDKEKSTLNYLTVTDFLNKIMDNTNTEAVYETETSSDCSVELDTEDTVTTDEASKALKFDDNIPTFDVYSNYSMKDSLKFTMVATDTYGDTGENVENITFYIPDGSMDVYTDNKNYFSAVTKTGINIEVELLSKIDKSIFESKFEKERDAYKSNCVVDELEKTAYKITDKSTNTVTYVRGYFTGSSGVYYRVSYRQSEYNTDMENELDNILDYLALDK